MNNYLGFSEFTAATNNAKLQKVARDGSITVSRRKYFADELVPYIGKHVKAFIDVEGASAICFTPFDKIYICNAQNPALWKALLEATA